MVREIINFDPIDFEYAGKYHRKGIHDIRYLPKTAPFHFLTDNAIVENKIVITSLKKRLFVVIIESKEIVDTYRALFDLAWQGAKEIK